MKKLLPAILLSTLSLSVFANEHFYKEYTLKSGESIAGLIFTIHSKTKQEKLSLIESSLRVNKLSSTQARKLPIGQSVMIPVDVYEYHNKEDKTAEVAAPAEEAPVEKIEEPTVEEPVVAVAPIVEEPVSVADENFNDQEDEITTQNSALARIDTSLRSKSKDSSERTPLFVDFSMENTNLHTDKAFNDNENQKADVQSLHLGLYALLTENIMFGGEISKDTNASKENFAAEEISSTIGASYNLPVNNSFSMEALAFYQNRNYNFEGLSIGGFGKINQKSIFVGARGTYTISDYYAFVGGVDVALSTEVENTAFNAIEFENTKLIQMEFAFQYTINDVFQTYIAVANEKNTWEKDSKTINYNSDLFKLGLIFRL
jgi:hypothetical protein